MVAGAIAGIATVVNEHRRRQEELNKEIAAYNDLMREGANADNAGQFQAHIDGIQNVLASYREAKAEIEALEAKKAELEGQKDDGGIFGILLVGKVEKNPDLGPRMAEYRAAIAVLEEAQAKGMALSGSLGALARDAETVAAAIRFLTNEQKRENDELEKLEKLSKQQQESLSLTAAGLKEQIKSIQDLNAAYQTLSKGEQLSADTLLELIELYPEVSKHISENADWRETLIGVIEAESKAEREAVLEKLRLKKQELEAERDRLMGIQDAAKSSAEATDAEMADKKRIMQDFALFVADLANKMANGEMLTAQTIQTVGTTALDKLKQAALDKINQEIAVLDAKIQAVESLDAKYQRSVGGGSYGAQEKVKTADEIAKELFDIDMKVFENEKALREMSAKDEIQKLEEIRAAHRGYAAGVLDIDKKLHSLRRGELNTWVEDQKKAIYEANKRGDTYDFSGIMKALQKLSDSEILSNAEEEYAVTVKDIREKLNDAIIDLTEDRSRKVQGIEQKEADEIKTIFNRTMTEIDREIARSRAKSGLVENGQAFKYGAADELIDEQKRASQIQKEINLLVAKGDKLNEAEQKYLKELYEQQDNHNEKMLLLQIKTDQESQSEAKKAADELLKIREQAKKAVIQSEKDATKGRIDVIKDRYTKEIRMAEDTANAEIAIIENKIRAIDDLMKEDDRADQDAEYMDRIRRLQEQLAYENDAANKYELEKEVSSLTDEYNKRKRKEALEDEKTGLRDQITAVKDNLSEQKQLLQDLRDAEIKAQEAALASFIEKQETKATTATQTETAITETEKDALDKRLENEKAFYTDSKKELDKALDKTEKSVKNTTTNIIEQLLSRIQEFADAGRQAGSAWADAYQAEVDRILESTAAAGEAAVSSVTNNNNTQNAYSFQQNFNTPTVTASQLSWQNAQLVEQIGRMML